MDALEKAKAEYWLHQDRIQMSTDERLRRHQAELDMAKLEQLERLNNILEGGIPSKFLDVLQNILKEITNERKES